jgi:SAM-dependent methyltransferase
MDRLPYFLPADLKELQRQSVLTSITSRIFGAPTCTPIDPLNPPRKILDFCCGDAYWTTLCHEYFCSLGIYHVQFTGIDIGHFAPDWKRYGINWNFVQHDARDFPLPFPDGHFDRVMISNCVFVFQNDISIFAKVMNEMHRLIAPGGFIEIRDSEYQVRRLVPNAKVPEGLTLEDKLIAQELGVYFTTDADDYAPCENQYMQDLNNWMFRFMEQTNNATDSVLQVQKVKELPGFEEIKSKVIAIPFSSPLIWEDPEDLRNDSIDLLHKRKYVSNTDRTALREAALQVIIDFAEALEPHLREVCGKTEEEWDRWWDLMLANASTADCYDTGDCLVIGSWLCRKIVIENPQIIVI